MKAGQARVFSDEEFLSLLNEVSKHRHPEKNRLILMLQFKLGLRVQEESLLQVKEVAFIDPSMPLGFKIKEDLVLPASYTKGANAMKRKKAGESSPAAPRTTFSFSRIDFDALVQRIAKDAISAGSDAIKPSMYYPEPMRKNKGRSRVLPMVDKELRKAISDYLVIRLEGCPGLKPTDPLIVSQKGGAYSPNTLQQHIATMMKEWALLERASSHSGRRTVLTKLYKNTKDIKLTQNMAGHADASTTVIYTEATEVELKAALEKIGK